MKKARFGLGVVLGAVVGIVTGLLTAPKSGKETRQELKRRSDEAKEKTASHVEDAKERVARVAQSTRAAIDDEIDDLQDKKSAVRDKE
jgi:gas vesicle protein